MAKVFVLLLIAAVLSAGVFGALHNQLSYSVGSSYFHDFKFAQFGIAPEMQNRLGAALVGWRASWWMGLIIGTPAFLLGMFTMARPQAYLGAGLGALFAVVLLTLVASIAGLTLGMVWADAPFTSSIAVPEGVTDRAGFLRAALMHDASYFGGLIGGLVAVWIMLRAARIERAALKMKKSS